MLKNLWVSKKRQFVSFPGDRNRGIVSRLFPYSNYKLEMVVTNGRGDGPRSEMKEFPTPEGGMFPQGILRDPSEEGLEPSITWALSPSVASLKPQLELAPDPFSIPKNPSVKGSGHLSQEDFGLSERNICKTLS